MSYPASLFQKLSIVALMALAAACASSPSGSGKGGASPHYKVGKSYKVNGKWYHPEEDPSYSKVGVASWYGEQFHGRLTANGEIFDMNRLSAAHTTLPMPSMVEVTNLENGRSITVRLNDRGPFVGDRIIDMSREAARRLGFEHQGTAKVRVRYVGPAPLHAEAPKYAAKPQRIVRAAPVRTEARMEQPKPGVTPENDEISDLLTSMENAPALTPGAEKAVIAQSEAGAAGEADIPAADLSTPDPADARIVHASPAPGEELEAIYLVRVAALSRLDNIEAMRAQLGDLGVLRMSRVETDGGLVFYRVNLGPFSSIETASNRLEAVRLAGYADAALVTLTP